MKNKFVHLIRHAFDFGLLAAIIGFGLAAVLYFRFDFTAQIAAIILMSLLYVFWGIYHHSHDGNLTAKVVLEYITVAILVATILVTLLLRS